MTTLESSEAAGEGPAAGVASGAGEGTVASGGDLPTSGENLTVAQAFKLAFTVQQKGYLESADEIYRRVLAAEPDHLDALHFMALGRYRMGRQAEALEMLQQVLARDPSNIHARTNLGNMLTESDRLPEAREAYEQVLAQHPTAAAGHANLGVVLEKQGDVVAAEAAFRRALELDPKHASALHNLASLLWDLDRLGEALTLYQQSLVLMPYDGESYRRVGASLAALGRNDEAIAVYERWVTLEPDNELARHMIAAASGRDVPSRASDKFVAGTFDMFANTFDKVLKRLCYQAPSLVASATAAALGPAAQTLDVLDAGAGTGLCGESLRAYARKLVGIDLSAGMLEKAKQRAVYDELVVAELTAYMREHRGEFDLIASADTLCYFGELDEVMAAAAAALRPGGHLVFTVEHAPPALGLDHQLNPHGRYSHAEGYVRRVLSAAGLEVVKLDRASLRLESLHPVDGLVVTAQRSR
jgi:predicted TPR repeat methyltransferase